MKKNSTFDTLKKMILKTNGRIFRIVFIKRSDGNIRDMRARTKNPTGGTPAYNADDYNLIHVWDLNKAGWRSIPLESIQYFKCGNIQFGTPLCNDTEN